MIGGTIGSYKYSWSLSIISPTGTRSTVGSTYRRMMTVVWILAGLASVGCQLTSSPTPLPPAAPAVVVEVPASVMGSKCAIHLHGSPRASHVYYGTVKEVTDTEVVLVDAYAEGRVERGVPVVEHVPYVSRLFKNVGIGRQTFDHEVHIPRKDIQSLEPEAEPIAD